MGSKDAPQKMQFLGATKKVWALLYKTQKWRETPKDSTVSEAK